MSISYHMYLDFYIGALDDHVVELIIPAAVSKGSYKITC